MRCPASAIKESPDVVACSVGGSEQPEKGGGLDRGVWRAPTQSVPYVKRLQAGYSFRTGNGLLHPVPTEVALVRLQAGSSGGDGLTSCWIVSVVTAEMSSES